MKKIKFYVLAISLLSIFGSATAQSIADEVKNNENKAKLKKQMESESANKQQRDEQAIKEKAFIVFCDPNGKGFFSFYNGVVYTGRVSYGQPQSLSAATYNLNPKGMSGPRKYVKKGNVLSWTDDFSNINLSYVDKYEIHLDTLTIYRKTQSNSIYQDNCKLIQDINRP
jgi:hypothetical protein